MGASILRPKPLGEDRLEIRDVDVLDRDYGNVVACSDCDLAFGFLHVYGVIGKPERLDECPV